MAWMKFEDFLNQNPQFRTNEPTEDFMPVRVKTRSMSRPKAIVSIPRPGPDMPVDTSSSTAESLIGKVKIPKPGPKVPGKTKSGPSKKFRGTPLDRIVPEEDFEPIVYQLSDDTSSKRRFSRRPLVDRLEEARATGDKGEEVRILRLMRNKRELNKAKRKNYKSQNYVESLREKIQRDIDLDPDRVILRESINEAFEIFGIPTARPVNFRPVTRKQKSAARQKTVEIEAFNHEQSLLDPDYRRKQMEKTWKREARRPIKGAFGPPAPFTTEAADLELFSFRRMVGYEKGAKGVFQSIAERQIAEIDEELAFLDTLPGQEYKNANTPEGQVYKDRILELSERRKYLRRMSRSKTTMKEINLDYANHMRLIDEAKSIGIDVTQYGINRGPGVIDSLAEAIEEKRNLIKEEVKRKASLVDLPNFDYTQKFRGSIMAQESQQRAVISASQAAVPSNMPARMSSSMADTIAQDTMRAASVIHSSKLGFAAVGAGAIAAVFGVGSMMNHRRNLEQEIQNRM